MTKRGKRLTLVAGVLVAVGGAVALTLIALSSAVAYFYAPSELLELAEPPGRTIRIGGLVADGSVRRETQDGAERVRFMVTDGASAIEVAYAGILPDLFREGQGVVAEGRWSGDGPFEARTILAKHDENYRPRELEDALKEGRMRSETLAD